VIVGISYDTPEENRAFAEAEQFPFRLLSDTDRRIAQAYGAANPPDSDWASVPKRLTYLIDAGGTVQKIYKVKDVTAHPQDVLNDIVAASQH
jgi:thioredoxin-dependent peroxiredoxin